MMVNRKLALGYAGWRHAWELATGKGLAAGAWAGRLAYFVNRERLGGWVGWRDTYEEKRRKLDSMKRSLKHMVNRKRRAGGTRGAKWSR